jgi:hypothetical protein
MTYIVNWASKNAQGILGKLPIVLVDKTIDNTSTSLALTGKAVTNYGEIQQTNFLQLLENFTSNIAPLHPTIGQLWFCNLDSTLYLCVNPLNTLPIAMGGPTIYFASGGLGWIRVSSSSVADVITAIGYTPYPSTNPAQYITASQAPVQSVTVAPAMSGIVSVSTGQYPTITINQSTASVSGYLSYTDWGIFNAKVTSVTASSPVVSSGGKTPNISLALATTGVDGYLSGADWAVFNAKISAVSVSSPLQSSGGKSPNISIPPSSAQADGFLTGGDWGLFNAKVTSVSGTGPIVSSGGKTPAISIPQATSAVDGFLSHLDWSAFNAKQPALGYSPVDRAGDSMSNFLTLHAKPTLPLHAATKSYVDDMATTDISNANTYANTVGSNTLTSSKAYTDTVATSTLSSANSYSNTVGSNTLSSANTYSNTVGSNTLASSKTYTDTVASSTLSSANTYTNNTASSTLSSANAFSNTVGTNILSSANTYTNNTASSTLSSANTYAAAAAAAATTTVTTAETNNAWFQLMATTLSTGPVAQALVDPHLVFQPSTGNLWSSQITTPKATLNRILLGDGSATTPSLAFVSDTGQDTGFYWESDGIISFAANGVKAGMIYGPHLQMVGTISGNAVVAPTQATSDSSTNMATTAFVHNAIAAAPAPTTLTVSTSAPASPVSGAMWYDIGATGRTYVWTGYEWVDASPAGAGSGAGVGSSGQVWQAVSRGKDTTYTNSTGKAIAVSVAFASGGGPAWTYYVIVGGIVIINGGQSDTTNGGTAFPLSFIVPDGKTYLVHTSVNNIYVWAELR